MGLLNFKRSRKQGPTPSPPTESGVTNSSLLYAHKLDYSPIMKENDTSLMDDIMNELDSPLAKEKPFTPLIKFDSPAPPAPKSPLPAKTSPRPLVANPPLHSDDDSESDEGHPLKQRLSAPKVNKQLLLRMKERHRQEVTKKIEPSLSMPALDKPRFYKAPQNPIARSTSAMTSLVPLHRPEMVPKPKQPTLASSPTFIRNSFSHFPQQHHLMAKEDWVPSKKLQINRSVSAYPIFQRPIQSPPENRPLEARQSPEIRADIKQEIRQETFHELRQLEIRQQEVMQQEIRQREDEMRHKLEIQELKRQQELQVQHDMQKQQQQIITQQQQQLQQLHHQQHILIGQQQYQQQQQQQQLLLQQQQIQKLQQASLEARTKPRTRPLYDRKHCHHHHTHHRCKEHAATTTTAVKPPPEEKLEIPHTKQRTHSVRSSTKTIISEEEIKLPIKLQRELENMKMGRSIYSVPDLSSLAKETETKRTKKTVEPSFQIPPVFFYYFKDCHHKGNCQRSPKKHSPHCHLFNKEEPTAASMIST
ncbi:hypothetical protein BY458DRAFT_158299 [Sporodiniella umbellata]|nr:hypothetical protein BY458DRAFT_158299 [Sporodiniella umbellata]